jgi:predicted RNase H-like HicB family nuclease
MFLTSFIRTEWTIENYPIRASFQPANKMSDASRLKPIPWTASVINWPAMSGNGNTKQEALAELRERFEEFKAKENKLPRPGTKVPIEFAVNDRVKQHPELAKDFFRRILEVDWAWISDESSLRDFHGDETNDRFVEKIRQLYGVDVSDIPNGNLANIFERIAQDASAKRLNSW